MNKSKLVHLISVTILICSVLIPSVIDFSREQKTASATVDSTEVAHQPIFHFTKAQFNEEIHKVVVLQIESDKPVNEVIVGLPREAKIQDDLLLEGQSYQVNELGQTIISQTQETMSFEFPLVFEASGDYTVSIESNDDSIVSTTISVATTELLTAAEEPLKQKTDGSTDILEDEVGATVENENSLEKDIALTNEKNSRAVANGVQDVATWEEFVRAFVNQSVSTINVIDDFVTPSNPRLNLTDITTGGTSNTTGNTTYVYLTAPAISRKLIIEGNNHQIDFRAVALCFRDATAVSNSPWELELKNLEIFHGNFYGPITFNDLNTANQQMSIITYDNITNIGNQLIHSPRSFVKVSGTTSSIQQQNYTSKFGPWRINATNQCNMEISRMALLKNSHLTLATLNAGNIDLGSETAGKLILEEGAKMNITANGTSGEANGVAVFVRSGSVTLEKNAEMLIVPQSNSSAISLTAREANFTIGENATVEIQSNGRTTNTNSNNSNILWMAAGSELLVDKGGRFAVNAVNQGTSGSNVVHVNGAATLRVGKDSTLDIKSDSTSQTQNLINFASANSIFQFSDAQKINLQRTQAMTGTGTTNGLINITGSTGLLDVDVQAVKQWNRGNLSETSDFNWIPIFNLKVRYTGTATRLDSISSISQGIVNSFRANFTTRNVQRVLFEKIPDVNVTIDELSEDTSLENSHVITGVANPGSVIRFTGDLAIPTGTISSSEINSVEKFHVIADTNGNYRYELPESSYFTAGNTVTAYAFLEGKSDASSTIVQERLTPPNPLDPLNPGEEIDPENKPNLPEEQGQLSIDFVSQFNFGTHSISAQDKTYYAAPQRLLNEDGTVNETEVRPNFIQVSDRRPSDKRGGWELSLSQESQFRTINGTELDGVELQLINAELISSQGNSKPNFVEMVQNLIPGVRQPLIIAEGDEGKGTWIYRFGDSVTANESVKIQIPKETNANAEMYSTTLVWELATIPGDFLITKK